MLKILGSVKIDKNTYQTLKGKFSGKFNDLNSFYTDLKTKNVFKSPVENFGRFDSLSKMCCCSVALALFDAKIDYKSKIFHKEDVGLVSTNKYGSLQSNIDYFKDYVVNGRKLARGNLFIYTLPSSALGETSIHFGLKGPVFYAGFEKNNFKELLDVAEELIVNSQAKLMIVIEFDEKSAHCVVVRK